MSKNNPENEVDVNALTQEELTAIANDEAETQTPAPKKRVFSRILAVLLALAPIALVCFLPVTLFLYGHIEYAVFFLMNGQYLAGIVSYTITISYAL